MKKITRPNHLVSAALKACISRIEDASFKVRADSANADFEQGETDYSEHATHHKLHDVKGQNNVGQLTRDEVVSLYDERLSKKGHPAREIYDSLRAAAKFNICPLCGQRQVASLDHYLPKSSHPLFAITPINLVPCCSDCNKAKSAKVGTDAASQTFHPYFDDFDDGVWLVARVIEANPPAILFSVSSPDGWSAVKIQRAVNHFNLLGLDELYGSNAAQELAQIANGLRELRETSGPGDVRRHLEHQATSRGANSPNSWQAAMYAALARCEWFWNGGHLAIQT